MNTRHSHNLVFKFVNVRAAQRLQDVGAPQLHLIHAPAAPKQAIVKATRTRGMYRSSLRESAQKILAEVSAGLAATRIVDTMRSVLGVKASTAEEAHKRLEKLTGTSASAWLKSAELVKASADTWERYYCLAVLGHDRSEEILQLRALEALRRLATAEKHSPADAWIAVLTWRPLVPKELFSVPVKATLPAVKPDKVKQGVDALLHEIHLLTLVESKVAAADAAHHLHPAPKAKANAKAAKKEEPQTRGQVSTPFGSWLHEMVTQRKTGTLFGKEESALLSRHQSLLAGQSERDGLAAIRGDIYRRAKQLLRYPSYDLPHKILTQAGTQNLITTLGLPASARIMGGSHPHADEDAKPASQPGALPRVHRLGIGDLIMVEDQIVRYEPGEIAHIENVMASETRKRTHVRSAERETTLTRESEDLSADEKSLQTTNRFELSKASESATESRLEASGGLSVSAGYGPVNVTASAGLVASNSSTTSNRSASTIAREGVDKAVSKVTRRVREEQVSRELNRTIETNEHGFTNGNASHITGIYRWVDKFHAVRAVNYGRRLMLEMIVPEPANRLGMGEAAAHGHDYEAPPALEFGPAYLNRDNYLDYAALYGATDIPVPPRNAIWVSANFGGQKTGGGSNVVAEKQVVIPAGYLATYAITNSSHGGQFLAGHTEVWPLDPAYLTSAGMPVQPMFGGAALVGLADKVSLSAMTVNDNFQVGWSILCELSRQGWEEWQLKAWAALKQARDQAEAEHNDRLAARSIAAGVAIHGHNPGDNKELIRNELRRAAIRFLSDDMDQIIVSGQVRQREVFDAADEEGGFDLAEARLEGRIIQFFEQAFEWQNMTWSLYPYFWAKPSHQATKLAAQDPDPAMRAFLMAGAARVVVPVPPEFEDAVAWFFSTQEIWEGGEPPTIDDPEFVSLLEEVSRNRTPDSSPPLPYEGAQTPPPFIVDEWEVKVPTSLVILQSDSTLPSFPGLAETHVGQLLDAAAAQQTRGAQWRNSIVDLLTLVGVVNAIDPAVRRAHAQSLGYPGNSADDPISGVDSWTYFAVIQSIRFNGLP